MRGSADIDGLVAHGLDRYRAGDIDGALTAWEAALAADPDDPRALGYVDYVRQNYDELSGDGQLPMSEMLIPFGLAHGDDDDDYEVSITPGEPEGADRAESATQPNRGSPASAPEPSVDDGWGLDADSEPTWFTGPTRQALDLAAAAYAGLERPDPGSGWIELEADEPAPGSRSVSEGGFGDDERTRDFQQVRAALPFDLAPDFAAEPSADQSGEATLELGRAEFGAEFTGERTTERRAAQLAPEVMRGLGLGGSVASGERRAGSEELTTEAWPHGQLDLAPPSVEVDLPALGLGEPSLADLGAPIVEPLPPPERFEDEGTADLKGKVQQAWAAARDDDRRPIEVEELLLPPPPSALGVVDDDSRDEPRGGRGLTADQEVTARLSEEIDRGAPPRESHDERARRRIAALLERAQAAASAEDHSTAVAAIDLALSEAPEVAAAQKLVHRSRDLILDCYYRFFGSLDKMPVLAAPLAELTRRPLDPRAAFLLSRIDGSLTFDEVLDVAGMGRLEACRHLAHLLWRGVWISS